MHETIIGGIIAGIVLGILAWLYQCCRRAFENIRKDNMFALAFVDAAGGNEIDIGSFHIVPPEKSDHWVKVTTSIGLGLSNFNFRFIPIEELSKRHNTPPSNISPMISLVTLETIPEIHVQGHKLTVSHDRYGGIDGVFDPPYPLAKDKAIFFKIRARALKIWSGKLSFMAYDAEYCPRYARTDARITDDARPWTPNPIKIYTATVSEVIDGKVENKHIEYPTD